MKNKFLYNQKNKTDLMKEINGEKINRITCSFYKYVKIKNLNELRNNLYINWKSLDVLGRIYIADEGINGQVSVPENNFKKFKSNLMSHEIFKNINIKIAIVEGLSFLKLTIKIKNEIVAYKISNRQYDMKNVGKHLNYKEFNKAIDDGAIVVDVRNYYEGEIGKFENAIIPDIERSEELLPEIKRLLKNHKNDKILMYCTGGIRCEKASSYLLKQGFKDINQLNGGIIQYASDIKKNKVKSKFIGKNFVFDHRMGESITDDIISKCHQCQSPSDTHRNCENQSCHILFIQCEKCNEKFNGCCTDNCKDFIKLSKEKQKKLFKTGKYKFTAQLSSNIKPKLHY